MDKTSLQIYVETARAREAKRHAEAEKRRAMGWEAARRAAKILKEGFGASRVSVFGSLAHGAWFGPRSDIDLAIEGVSPEDFWRAWCALDALGADFEVNLVAWEAVSEAMGKEIAREGVEL